MVFLSPNTQLICFSKDGRILGVQLHSFPASTCSTLASGPTATFGDLQARKPLGSGRNILELEIDEVFVAASTGNHKLFRSVGSQCSLQAVCTFQAPHVLTAWSPDSRQQWSNATGKYMNACFPYQELGFDVHNVVLIQRIKKNLMQRKNHMESSLAWMMLQIYSRKASLQQRVVLDVQQVAAVQERLLPCNGAMILFQNIDETFVNVKASTATWDVELVIEHGTQGLQQYPLSAAFLVQRHEDVDVSVSFSAVGAEGRRLTGPHSFAEASIDNLQPQDLATRWAACESGFVNMACPDKKLNWKVIELSAVLRGDLHNIHQSLASTQGSAATTADVTSPDSLHSASFRSAVSSVALDLECTGSSVQHDNYAEISSESAAPDNACSAAVIPSERQTAVPESSRSNLAPMQHEEAAAAVTFCDQQQDAAVQVQPCSSVASQPEPGVELGSEHTAAAVTGQEVLEDLEVKQLRLSLGWPPAASRMLISPKRVTAGALLNSTGKLIYAGTLAATGLSYSSAGGSWVNDVASSQVALQLFKDKMPFDHNILERHLVLQAHNPEAVCTVYGVTKLQDRICLVMTPLSRPHTLAAKLQQMPGARASVQQCLKYGSDISSSLECLHAAGQAADNLSLANIVIAVGGSAMLGFAIPDRAEACSSKRPDPFGVGKSLYRAPELMGVVAIASAKSNIWALGCILLEMYTGSTWPVGVVSAKLHRRPANDGLPEPLAAIILQCLHTNPQLRPSAADVTQVLQLLHSSFLNEDGK